jgi:hypothetical protein
MLWKRPGRERNILTVIPGRAGGASPESVTLAIVDMDSGFGTAPE